MADFNNLTDQFLILDRNDLTPTERLVALTLLSFRNSETGRCNPPIFSDDPEKKTICSRTGFTRQCVIKTLSSLEQKKIIVCKKLNARPSEITFTVNNDYRNPDLPVTSFTPTVNEDYRTVNNDYRSRKRRLPITKKEQRINKEDNKVEDSAKTDTTSDFLLTPVEKPTKRSSLKKPENITEQTWKDFNAIRKAKKAPLTETALNRIQSEATKAGIDLETALQVCCERGWQGFKADWYTRDNTKTPSPIRQTQQHEPTAEDFTDKQISFFAYKLSRFQPFCSAYGEGFQTYDAFATKIETWLRHPERFKKCLPYLKRLNLVN